MRNSDQCYCGFHMEDRMHNCIGVGYLYKMMGMYLFLSPQPPLLYLLLLKAPKFIFRLMVYYFVSQTCPSFLHTSFKDSLCICIFRPLSTPSFFKCMTRVFLPFLDHCLNYHTIYLFLTTFSASPLLSFSFQNFTMFVNKTTFYTFYIDQFV